jgi:hypothetical protein
VPKEVFDSLIGQIAETSGLEVSEVKHWWNWNTTQEYTPRVDTEGVSKAAGAKQPEPNKKVEPGHLTKLYKGAQKVGQGISDVVDTTLGIPAKKKASQ